MTAAMREKIEKDLRWLIASMLDEFPSLRCHEDADTCEYDGCMHDIHGSDFLGFMEEQLRAMPHLKGLKLNPANDVEVIYDETLVYANEEDDGNDKHFQDDRPIEEGPL